ncbi:Ig-like domain-containing protein [Brevibacillus centrosporus]|uniref:Ig-like domain-containing protein n=1 Tax=Brevibacillus centrosporus TaxID=54910 RepID=UPI00398811BC
MNKKVALSVLSATVFASMAASAFAAPKSGLYIGGNVDKYYSMNTLLGGMSSSALDQFSTEIGSAGFGNLIYVDFDGKGASIAEIMSATDFDSAKKDLTADKFEGVYSNIKADGSADGTYDPRNDAIDTPTGDLKVESVSAIDLRTVEVKFGAAVDEITATDAANYELNGNALAAGASVKLSADKKTATITLDAADVLTNKTYITVTASLGNTILGENGSVLNEETKSIFVEDATKPVVSSTDYVKAADELTINFSELLQTEGTVTVKDKETGAVVTAPAALSGKVVTVDTAALTDGKEYVVTIVGAKDLAGNFLNNNKYELTFKTGSADVTAPTVTSVVAKSANLIEVTFSEKLSALGTLNTNALTAVATAADLDANYEVLVDATGLKYTIYVPAMADDSVTAYAFAAQEDLAGNPITAVTKNVPFNADATAPEVQNVSVAGKIATITFSEDVVDAGGTGTVLTPGGVLKTVADADIDSLTPRYNNKVQVDLSNVVTTIEAGTYKVTLPKDVIADADGNSKEYVLDVTLNNAQDTTKPQVVGTAVYTDAANAGTVAVEFNENVGASAIDVNNYTVDGVKVFKSAYFNNDNRHVVLTIDANKFDVDADREFKFTGVKDVAGNTADAYTQVINFKDNTAPQLVSAKLENDLTTITLSFTEALDPATLDGDAADYKVYVGDVLEAGAVEAIVAADTTNKTFKITLADALTATEYAKAITIKPTDDYEVADAGDNLAATFTSVTVAK